MKHFLHLILLCCSLAAITGCTSTKPSQFFLLEPITQNAEASAVEFKHKFVIWPVLLPNYLDRQQIVTRRAEHELYISEFHRWGEDLDANISRVLAANLVDSAEDYVFVVQSDITQADWTGRIIIDVQKFDARLPGKAELDIKWMVLWRPEEEEPVIARRSRFTADIESDSYSELVAKLSQLLDEFSDEVVEVLTPVVEAKEH